MSKHFYVSKSEYHVSIRVKLRALKILFAGLVAVFAIMVYYNPI